MKIDFCIQGQGVMGRDLTVSIDWDCPYIPRIGETIDTSILIDNIDPQKFYDTLSEREKADWGKQLTEVSDDFAILKSWLDDMIIDVEHIDWWKRNGEYGLFIMLKPDK